MSQGAPQSGRRGAGSTRSASTWVDQALLPRERRRDLADSLHVALARRPLFEDERQCDEDVDVFRRTSRAVNSDGDASAHGVADPGPNERLRDSVELVDQIHPQDGRTRVRGAFAC